MITLQRCNTLNYALNNQYRVCNNFQQKMQPFAKPIKNVSESVSDSVLKIILKAFSNIF